jgi:hypothetical protein
VQSAIAVADAPVDDELLARASSLASDDVKEADGRDARDRALEAAIRQRIDCRLRGRIRSLNIRVFDRVVLLEGQCATFYTKQLAQHAAMALINEEHLENAIVVSVPR